MTDIKQTLATAFDNEPPMSTDKPAIIRAGKRRALGRNVSIGMAVVAAVGVMVTVPITINSGGGGPGAVQVAEPNESSRTPISPPDPTFLPPQSPPKPVTAERAAELTVLLAASGVIPKDAPVAQIPGESAGPLQIRHLDGMGYKMYGQVTTSRGRGGLMIWLDMDQNRKRSCDGSSATRCEERQVDDRRLVMEDRDEIMGGLRTVYAWLPDGSVLLVQSSGSVPGESSPGTAPFDMDELVNIATQPWLTF